MKSIAAKLFLTAGIVTAATLFSASPLRAQAGPGPLHPAPQAAADNNENRPVAPIKKYPPLKKENLVGTWSINPDESDNAHEIIAKARGKYNPGGSSGSSSKSGSGNPPDPNSPSNGPSSGPNGGSSGPYGRPCGQTSPTGGPGSSRPCNPPPNSRRGPYSSTLTLEDHQQLQDLIEPGTSLTFTQKDGEVDVTDEQGRKRVFFTDSRTPKPPTDENYQESSAKWDEAKLVSQGKGLHGGDITRTYELTPSAKQLEETVGLISPHLGAVSIHYVFDLATTPPTSSATK